MRPRETARYVLSLLAVAALGSCGYSSWQKQTDYKSATQAPPLEVPPDLLKPTGDERYKLPENARTSTTFSDYNRERTGQRAGALTVLPELPNARVVRDGSQRWLVVKGAPEQIWPLVKDFWQETGFIVNLEVPESGVMETDWAETRSKVQDGMLRRALSWLTDVFYSSSERDKFRTRFERGTEPGTTEIYVSHRGMQEVYVTEYLEGGNRDTRWQPRPTDPDLEAEMLGRMMVRFGADEVRAKATIAKPEILQLRAKLSKGPDGAETLALDEQFDRAWRRVGLALDRVGFTVEDRDRSKGVYFVRYVDPQIDKAVEDKGFLSKLKFWGSDKSKPELYQIEVKNVAQGSEINVLKNGSQESSDIPARILSLLYEQLK